MRPISRPATLTALALAAALTLTACGSDDSGSDATPFSAGADSTSQTTPGTDAETTDADATEEPTSEPTRLEVQYDVAAVEFGEPGALTNPGTPLAKGEPAWLDQTATYGEEEVTGPVALSVLDVRALDASIFDQYSNAADFAEYTPYAITFQQQWFYDIPEDYDPTTVDLFPLMEDGTDAEYLTGQFGFGAAKNTCGLQLPGYDEETKTLVSCIIGLSKDQPITTAMYNGEGYLSFMASPDNAYFTQPLSWS